MFALSLSLEKMRYFHRFPAFLPLFSIVRSFVVTSTEFIIRAEGDPVSDVKNVFERKRTFFTAERGSVVELDAIWNGNCKVGGHVRSSKSMAAATLL